jgi:hypothetical protein
MSKEPKDNEKIGIRGDVKAVNVLCHPRVCC